MKWFLNLATRGKLYIGFGLMTGFLLTVIVIAYFTIADIRSAQDKLYRSEFANATDLLLLRNHQNGARAAVLNLILNVNRPGDRDRWYQEIRERSGEITLITQRLLERNRHNPQLLEKIKELTAVREALVKTREEEIIPLIQAGEMERAKALVTGVQEERFRKIRDLGRELGDLVQQEARTAVAQSELKAERTLQVFFAVGLVAVLSGIALVFLLDRVIAVPLRDVAGVAGRVAAGDLTTRVVRDERTDEVGILMQAFEVMVANLHRMMEELHEGVEVLASSSNEILATTTQVASGAAETATAVAETTTTVEEVKQTAQLASHKSRHVADVAQRVAQTAQNGRRAVEEVIHGMHRIQEQMESIAESIVRLSEQTQAIAEINATVNDLAEQSNLLAVNAAIEASKVGEQGKGFAVVAQEVKNLAEQSKQATAQVRAILGEIQKATSAAVLTAEQGHKAVEAGVKQSAEAGESIRLLAESVEQAAQAATQIAASSQQQMVGMDQVAVAMENIKQASSQGVAGLKQAEATAQNAHELGLRLKELTARYRV